MSRLWRCAPLIGVLLLAGCAGGSSGRIVQTTSTATGEAVESVYSEYYEFYRIVLDGRLRVHLLVTLGSERLPPDWDGKLQRRQRADGMIEEVYEIYLSNLSDQPIAVSDLHLEVKPFLRTDLTPDPASIGAKQFIKTDPVVRIGSIYQQPTKNLTIRFTHEGQRLEIVGVAGRLRVDELPGAVRSPDSPPGR